MEHLEIKKAQHQTENLAHTQKGIPIITSNLSKLRSRPEGRIFLQQNFTIRVKIRDAGKILRTLV